MGEECPPSFFFYGRPPFPLGIGGGEEPPVVQLGPLLHVVIGGGPSRTKNFSNRFHVFANIVGWDSFKFSVVEFCSSGEQGKRENGSLQ